MGANGNVLYLDWGIFAWVFVKTHLTVYFIFSPTVYFKCVYFLYENYNSTFYFKNKKEDKKEVKRVGGGRGRGKRR